MSVWALEPYFGGSHRHFLEGLARHSHHDLTLFTLPGRNWKWRMHGGALAIADQVRAHEESMGTKPDLFFASDMLDLGVFLSAVGPRLNDVPALLFMHENQLTYPLPPGVERDLGYGFKNVTSAAVAEAVIFNTEFHRAEFVKAISELLDGMPDEIPRDVVEEIRSRSRVVHVGCDLRRLEEHRDKGQRENEQKRWGDPADGPLLLWNQRWEYDKAPQDLFSALYELADAGVDFRLAMAGPNQGTPTASFAEAKKRLVDRIVQWGRVEEGADYASLLWAADVVASTALHEFFGVAVVEAIYCGCRPVLPRRLSYPEIIPEEAQAAVLYDEGGLVKGLERALGEPNGWSVDWQRAWVARFDWGALAGTYDEVMESCLRSGGRSTVRRQQRDLRTEAGL